MSTRVTQAPVWMKDYIVLVGISSLESVSNTITPPTLPYTIIFVIYKVHISYLYNLTMAKEPHSFMEACKYPECINAMNLDLDALVQNQTWELTDLPLDKRPKGCKWAYKLKLNADATVERCKACFVAKAYTQ